jgi:hypothetical protein
VVASAADPVEENMQSKSVWPVALFVAISIALPGVAAANMSYTPWVHELNQVGQDVEVTVQVFEESDTLLGEDEIPVPDLGSAYTLTRSGTDEFETLLEDHVFAAGDAFEVTEFGCVPRNIWGSDSCPGSEHCEDCDDDGEAECDGLCAVTYRFLVIDECAPPGDALYYIRTPETESVWYENEGLGFTNTVVEDTGAACLDDSGCSVSGVGAGSGAGLALFLLGIGLVAATLGRRKIR